MTTSPTYTASRKSGTAILMKEGISLNNIKNLPSGLGIAGIFEDTWTINVYAPSGAEKRQEREKFLYQRTCVSAPNRPKRNNICWRF